MRSKITQKDINDIIGLRKASYTYKEIMSQTGICQATISRILKEAGLTVHNRGGGGYPKYLRQYQGVV